MRRLCYLWIILFGLSVSPARANDPAAILRLVPDDYTFCIFSNDSKRLFQQEPTRLTRAFWNSALVQEALKTPEFARLQQAKDHLTKELGVTDTELIQATLGGTAALAYRKPTATDTAKEAGVLILRSPEPKALKKLVDRINELQTQSGELKTLEQVTKPNSYVKRVKTDQAASAEYYSLVEGLLIFSPNEIILNEILNNLKKTTSSVAERQQATLADPDAPLTLLINPRSFDGDVDELETLAKPSEKPVIKLFRQTWKGMDHVAISLTMKPVPTLALSLGADPAKLPSSILGLIEGYGRPLRLWANLPTESLISIVLPFQPTSFDRVFREIAPSEEYAKLRQSIISAVQPLGEEVAWDELLKQVGPEIAFWMLPPDAASERNFAAAVSLNPNQLAQAKKTAIDGIEFGVRLLVVQDSNYKVTTIKEDNYTIKKLSHPNFPKGLEPCYAIRDSVLVLASNPATLRTYSSDLPAKKATSTTLIKMSGSTWKTFVSERPEFLARVISGNNPPDDMALKIVKNMATLFAEIDRLELNVFTSPKQATLQLQLMERRP